jgi:hypothetical protein
VNYYVIKDKKDRSVAIVCHDYLTSYYLCRSRSEAFTRVFYGVARKNALGKLVKKEDHVVFSKIDASYPMWMDRVLKGVIGEYWSISNRGEIEGEMDVDRLVKKFFK